MDFNEEKAERRHPRPAIMWSHGAGSDVMKRIAAPMVGGVTTSFLLELLIYPVIFTVWKWHAEVKHAVVRTDQ